MAFAGKIFEFVIFLSCKQSVLLFEFSIEKVCPSTPKFDKGTRIGFEICFDDKTLQIQSKVRNTESNMSQY